jgi:hypothetical protein
MVYIQIERDFARCRNAIVTNIRRAGVASASGSPKVRLQSRLA